MQWVVDCLKRQTLIAEEAYEVASNAKASIPGAPRRARLAIAAASVRPLRRHMSSSVLPGQCIFDIYTLLMNTQAGLFSSHRVLLFGQFPQPGPAKSDIRFLLERGAAVLCGGASDLLLCLSERSSAPKQSVR